jgi:D-alanine-D-alanine ligase
MTQVLDGQPLCAGPVVSLSPLDQEPEEPPSGRPLASVLPTTPRPTRRTRRRLALVCNVKPTGMPAAQTDENEEFDSPETIGALAQLFASQGYNVTVLEADRNLPRRLTTGNFDLVFNIAEGRGGRCREALVPALCEMLGLHYTGSDPLTLAATLDKDVAKRLLLGKVNTPAWRVVRRLSDLQDFDLAFPVIAKPNDEGSSKGIHDDCKCNDFNALETLCRRLLDDYGRPVLVEAFVRGPEVTVGVVGNAQPEVIGLMHVVPTTLAPDELGEFIYSLQAKRDFANRVRYAIPPELPQETCQKLEAAALQAFRLLDCRDVARIDFRVGPDGEPYFIEANPLPGLSPATGDLVIMAKAMGWTWEGLITRILREAEFRQGVLRPMLVPKHEPKRKKPRPLGLVTLADETVVAVVR